MIQSTASRRLKTKKITLRIQRIDQISKCTGLNLINVVLLAILSMYYPMPSWAVHPDAPFRSRIYRMPRYLVYTESWELRAKKMKKHRRVHADAHAYAYVDADADANVDK